MKLQLIGHEHRYSLSRQLLLLNRKASLCEEIPPSTPVTD